MFFSVVSHHSLLCLIKAYSVAKLVKKIQTTNIFIAWMKKFKTIKTFKTIKMVAAKAPTATVRDHS